MKRLKRPLAGGWICACALAIMAVASAFTGCMHPGSQDPARLGPFYQPTNWTRDPQLPATLRRVVLLPVASGSVAPPETAAMLQTVFLTELQKENRFEIVPITRAEFLQRFGLQEIASTAALPADFMARLQREFGADGVLFLDLTAYKPYRPLAMGVRAKLTTANSAARVLWAFDNLFSATDATVANAARHHFLEMDRRGVPADFTQAVLQSPSRFGSYVAATMFATLPPVYAPPPPPRK